MACFLAFLAKVKGVHISTTAARQGNVAEEEEEEDAFRENADLYFDFGEVRISTVAMAGSILIVGATAVAMAGSIPNVGATAVAMAGSIPIVGATAVAMAIPIVGVTAVAMAILIVVATAVAMAGSILIVGATAVAMAGSILIVGATVGLGNVTTAGCLPICYPTSTRRRAPVDPSVCDQTKQGSKLGECLLS